MPEDTTTPKSDKVEAEIPRAKPTADTKFRVKIYSPYKVYFDDDANSISAENDTGPFDILPMHKNFLSILRPCDLIVRHDRGEDKFEITRGIMHVKAESVTVFLDV